VELAPGLRELLTETAESLSGAQRRLFMARALDKLGLGQRQAQAEFGWGRDTIRKGMHELRSGITCCDATSARGRRRIEEKYPGILATLEEMLADDTAGDPMNEDRWIRGSLSHLARRLKEAGYQVSHMTVGRMLRRMGFSLKGNKRRQSQIKCPERDEQFQYIALQRRTFSAVGLPIISVDTKKKELIGNFRNPGQVWCREAAEVDEHGFPSAAECVAVPFGVYDLTKNRGYVIVGMSHNTPEFAVSTIARWWQEEGHVTYPNADQLLILADGGGGNGSRAKAWKQNLQEKLCKRFGLTVTVCHYPPGCSKWNPVEHRLFSQISINWAGRPLRTLGIMLGYIRGTTTTTGLTVKAYLDEGIYRKGQKVAREEFERLMLKSHSVCPSWNYTISPRQELLPSRDQDSTP
jgi:transposase